MFSCFLCRKHLVKWDGGLCYPCWHRIEFKRLSGQPEALFEQLDPFPEGAVENNKPAA